MEYNKYNSWPQAGRIVLIPIMIGLASQIAKTAPANAQIQVLTEEVVEDDGKENVEQKVVELTYERESSPPLFGTASNEPDVFKVKEYGVEFSSPSDEAPDIGKGFSNALGWVLWKSNNTSLREVSKLTGFELDDVSEADAKKASTLIFDPGTGKFEEVDAAAYAEWGLKQRLGIYQYDDTNKTYTKEGGSAILLSVRDSFSYFNASQEGFGINYSKNNGDSSLSLKGAIMMDFYLDPLYNREDSRLAKGNPYRFWLRTGVEFDRNEEVSSPTDRTSYYLLTNFQANPDQKAHLLGLESLPRIISPQFVQFGFAYDHDDFSGDDDFRWIVGWQPQYYAIKDFGFIGKSFGINRNMFFKKGTNLPELLAPDEAATLKSSDEISNFYSSIPVDLRLSGGSEILAQTFGGADSADEALLEWKAGLLWGYGPKIAESTTAARWRVGYFVEGASPVLDPGETHVGHRIVAEVGLGNLSSEYVETQMQNSKGIKDKKNDFEFTMLPTTALGAMTLFAEYRFGAPPPNYQKEEIFEIGTRIRF